MRIPAERLSKRAATLSESSTVGLTRRVGELRENGREILDLSAGQPDYQSPAPAVEEACKALRDGRTEYTSVAGLSELRGALAERLGRLYGAPWKGADVVVSVGAKAALFQIFQVTIDPGSEVIVPTPAWVSFGAQVGIAGGRVVEVVMDREDSFAFHADPIIAAFGPRTRVVVLNSPCNPTGAVIDAVELERLVSACFERGVLIVADETYERLVYDGVPHVSAATMAARYPDTVVVVGSFSKGYSMTGWRVGFLAGPRWVIDPVVRLQGHLTSNVTTFAMWGALEALRSADAVAEEMRCELERRREVLCAAISRSSALSCELPSGALYLLPRISGLGDRTSLEVAETLLEEGGVAVVPGSAFGAENHLRLCFARRRRTLEEAGARIVEVLARLS